MQSTNYWTGVGIILVAILALVALLTGHRSSDAPVHSTAQAVASESAVAPEELPEVVVTATRPATVALSERGTDATSDRSPRRHYR